MNKLLARFLVIGMCSLGACAQADPAGGSPPGSEGSPDEVSVWVARVYSGGRQCDPREDFTPPDTRAVLEREGVRVHETTERDQGVCMACTCPAYAATHYARIAAGDVDEARGVGFEGSEPPPSND